MAVGGRDESEELGGVQAAIGRVAEDISVLLVWTNLWMGWSQSTGFHLT